MYTTHVLARISTACHFKLSHNPQPYWSGSQVSSNSSNPRQRTRSSNSFGLRNPVWRCVTRESNEVPLKRLASSQQSYVDVLHEPPYVDLKPVIPPQISSQRSCQRFGKDLAKQGETLMGQSLQPEQSHQSPDLFGVSCGMLIHVSFFGTCLRMKEFKSILQ